MNLTVLQSELFVIGVTTPSGTFKLFQILCRPDGSIFVPFPYFRHSSAQLIEMTMKAGQSYPADATVSGPVTLHRVKYSHHADGEAHFSQDGKIMTKVRRPANGLHNYSGHLFTVQLQGLGDFQRASERDFNKPGRMLVTLRFNSEPAALKLVAALYSKDAFRQTLTGSDTVGPWIRAVDRERERAAVLLAAAQNHEGVSRVLSLAFGQESKIFLNQESGLSFLGGFDPPDMAFDHRKDTSFLVLISPAGPDAVEAATKFGSVDLL